MRPKFFHFLVQRKARWLSRDFKQQAAGFAEINGMKISAIDYWRDIVAEIDEMLAPVELFGFVLRAKRNVMHRTGGNAPNRAVWLTQQVDNFARRRFVRGCKPKPVARFVNQTVAKTVRE